MGAEHSSERFNKKVWPLCESEREKGSDDCLRIRSEFMTLGKKMKYLAVILVGYITFSITTHAQINPLLNILMERRDLVSTWVSQCKTPERLGEISDFHNTCLQKDTLSWAGYSCLAATLAQDTATSTKRCTEVKNSQGANGRWWRGPGRVNIEVKDSFSRDMSLGLASWLIIKSESKKEAFIKWLDWIEKHGDGRMCIDSSDSRCEIKGNQKAVFKALLNEYKIHESVIKSHKVVKKFKEGYGFNLWSIETNFTPVDYQLHLKAIELLILKNLNSISDNHYLEVSRKIYEKDALNPFYEFLYMGISPRLVDRVLTMCPSARNLQKTLRHSYGGDWTWQRNSKERSWEIANGHDCVFMMNLMISELKGNLALPRLKPKKDCPLTSQKLGKLEDFPICAPLTRKKTSLAQCKNESTSQWTQGNKQWCLKLDSGRWIAEEIKEICPTGFNQLEDKNSYLVCEKKSVSNIRLYECMGSYQSITSEKISADSNPQWCFINEGQWYERKKISGTCPISYNFQKAYVWELWPVCKGPVVLKSKCDGPWDLKVNNECWQQKNGWFEVRKLD